MKKQHKYFWKPLVLKVSILFGNLFLLAGIISMGMAAIEGLFFIVMTFCDIEFFENLFTAHEMHSHICAGFSTICLWFGGTAQLFVGLSFLQLVHIKEEQDILRQAQTQLLQESQEKH